MDKKKESQLQIKFRDFYQDINGVTFFKIAVYDRETNKDWEFDERYSAMRDIHKSLRDQFKGELPDFPTKKWFGNTDKNFLSQRKATLQTYFTTLLNLLDVQKYPILKNFFYKNAQKAGAGNGEKADNKANSNTKSENIPQSDQKKVNGNTQQQNLGGSNNQGGNNVINEKQKQEMRTKAFAEQMMKVNEKYQNKFITNLTDYVTHQDEGIHQQKKAQISKLQFSLKSNLMSSQSLPAKCVEKPELSLQNNINNSKIVSDMDELAKKLVSVIEQNISSYHKVSSQIISGKNYNITNSD